MTSVPPPDDLADRAAPLDSLLVDAALRRGWMIPDASAAKLAAGLLRHPRATGRRLRRLAGDVADAAVGRSALAPERGDRRFTDPAWTQNPCCTVSCRRTSPRRTPPRDWSATPAWASGTSCERTS